MSTSQDRSQQTCGADCVSRRFFLSLSGAATVTAVLGDVFADRVVGQSPESTVEVTRLPRRLVAQSSNLRVDQPISFSYPDDSALANCLMVKTGEVSGGGVGDAQDIVAFSARCTHMGGNLDGLYNAEHKVAGPCGEHLTTFDLTRHGLVVAGHATQALPQIILDVEGDNIFATGIVGLLYGYAANI